jgi:hypothetical protein
MLLQMVFKFLLVSKYKFLLYWKVNLLSQLTNKVIHIFSGVNLTVILMLNMDNIPCYNSNKFVGKSLKLNFCQNVDGLLIS